MDDVNEVKRRINLVDLTQTYLPLRKAGSSWKGLCPFHQEKTPSFTVNIERQTFKCFGCNESGDAIDLVMKMEYLTFPEALQLLADRVGVILDKRKTPEQYSQEKDQKSRLYHINRLAAQVFHKILFDHPKATPARDYLTSRGLTDATIKAFGLGFAPAVERGTPSVLDRFLRARGFRSTESQQAGSPERFSNRIIFPLMDVLGNPIGFTGRALDSEDQPKYLNTPETPLFKKGRLLYPLDRAREAIKKNGRAIVVEGQMDVLLAHQLGTLETVATSGTALTADHLAILGRYTHRILFCFDQDAAGIEATRKAILLAYDLELEPFVVVLPENCKDLGELAITQPDRWQAEVTAAVPAVVWQLEIAQRASSGNDVSGKKLVGKLILPVLDRIRDPIEQAHWMQVVARTLKLPERTINDALDRYRRLLKERSPTGDMASTARPSHPVPVSPGPPKRTEPAELLLGLMLAYPEHLSSVIMRLEPKDFSSDAAIHLAKAIAGVYTRTGATSGGQFLKVVKAELSKAEVKWLDNLLSDVEQLHGSSDHAAIVREIQAGFDRLKLKRTDAVKESVAKAIAAAEASGDRQEVQRLLKSFQQMLGEQ